MASFYNQGGSGGTYNATGGGGAGFYNTAGPTTTSTSSTTTSTTTSSMTGMGGPSIPPQGTTYEQQSFGGSGSGMAHQQQQQSVYGNTQQWHQPTGQKQQHMYGQTPIEQQQQQPPAQPFWNPQASAAVSQAAAGFVTQAMTGSLSGDGVLDMASRLGTEAFKSGVPGLDGVMQTLRAYFAVDNRYVKRKMQKVLFPFTSKQWKRFQVEGPNMVNYAPPNTDENAPDLYLPVMSLITYCLLCALCYGTAGQFNPEVIASVTTKCFITQVAEVLIIRFGCYMMQTPIPFLDLFSYTGYKYLGLTINILFGILFGYLDWGRSGFYVTFLWTASAASFFMLKTMANNIPIETAAAGPKREVMVLAFAASQAVSMWFVSQTKYL